MRLNRHGPGADDKFIYAIEHPDGFWKLGKASNPRQRASAIQVGSPYELELRYFLRFSPAGSYVDWTPIEEIVHERFSDGHVRGEWFDTTADEVLRTFARLHHSSEYSRVLDVYDIELELQYRERFKGTSVEYRGPL